jgi:hypothetical protein
MPFTCLSTLESGEVSERITSSPCIAGPCVTVPSMRPPVAPPAGLPAVPAVIEPDGATPALDPEELAVPAELVPGVALLPVPALAGPAAPPPAALPATEPAPAAPPDAAPPAVPPDAEPPADPPPPDPPPEPPPPPPWAKAYRGDSRLQRVAVCTWTNGPSRLSPFDGNAVAKVAFPDDRPPTGGR